MLSDPEFENLLADPTKKIAHNIRWTLSDSHDGAQGFVVAVQSEAGWPLRITAWWNPESRKLSYALVHDDAGRIVGLCLGRGIVHHRPTCGRGRAAKRRCDCPRGTHKHLWTEQFGDQWAYAPPDITAGPDDPVAVWQQFCAEINLTHRGILLGAEGNARWSPSPLSSTP